MAGLAFWNCVSHLEFALFDMLGKLAGVPVCDLLGPVLRREIPIYLSSGHRDTTPEEEVSWVGERLAATNAGAVKLKIGGRMSFNADAAPGRTDRLVSLARETLGKLGLTNVRYVTDKSSAEERNKERDVFDRPLPKDVRLVVHTVPVRREPEKSE